MAQIGRFNDVGVHERDGALQVDPAKGGHQEFGQLRSDASSTDQQQVSWRLLFVHTGVGS